jgi:hypothetical protein
MIKPIIVVGAGRSGTKMLRAVITSHPDVVCFPTEINYIWRYGNRKIDTDELKPEHARPEVIDYIRRRFKQLSKQFNSEIIVEKTCANSLRVNFVHAILPNACIIHLVRDGRAVAESALRCWQGRPSGRYLLRKARWVPPRDILYYAFRYIRYQLGRFNRHDTKQKSWGPRFAQLDELVKEKMLIEVCGIQWKICVQAAETAIGQLPSGQALTIRYEDIVGSPLATIGRVFDKINLTFIPECQDYVMRTVTGAHLHKWQRELSGQDLHLLLPHIKNELLQYGYEI